MNHYLWILENPKCGTVTERVSRKKYGVKRCIICIWYMYLCVWIFSINRARWRSKNCIYFCLARQSSSHIGISYHIGICRIWNLNHAIAQYLDPNDTLSAHVIISQAQLWRYKLCFWIFQEIALGDGPKNSWIRVNFWILKTYLIYFLVGFRDAKTMDTHSIFPRCSAIWSGFLSRTRIFYFKSR